MAILPRRSKRRRPVPNAHRPDAVLESSPERSVIVANQILRCGIPWKCLGDLARQPFGRWVAGYRKPQQLPALVAQNKTCKQLLKPNRRDHEQIDRHNALGMIVQEGLPSLQRPTPPRHHVDRNRRLGDLDPELEQFAMHFGGAPQRILKAHPSDQVAELLGDPRAASRRPGFPPPVSGKALVMPTNHSFWLDDGDGIQNARAASIKPDEQRPVDPTQVPLATRSTLLQDVQLMTQDQDFGLQPPLRLEAVAQRAQEQETNRDHLAIMFRFASPGESNGWSFQKRQASAGTASRRTSRPSGEYS
jgi:hypothetical protein